MQIDNKAAGKTTNDDINYNPKKNYAINYITIMALSDEDRDKQKLFWGLSNHFPSNQLILAFNG